MLHVPNLKSEAGGEEGSLKEQHDQVLDWLVLLLICLSLLLFILWQLKTFLTQTSPLLQASLSRRGKFQILGNLSDQDKVLPLVLLQLLDHIFVNRLSHEHLWLTALYVREDTHWQLWSEQKMEHKSPQNHASYGASQMRTWTRHPWTPQWCSRCPSDSLSSWPRRLASFSEAEVCYLSGSQPTSCN